MTLNVSVIPSGNGSYSISVTGTDVYDFGYNNEDYGNALGTAANVAYFSQGTEVISNFNINVDFKHKFNPEVQRKKKEHDSN